MDTLAMTAAPRNAIPIWTDGLSLFTELPSPSGPYVIRYPLTSAGLSSALALVRTHAYDTLDRSPPPAKIPHATDPGVIARNRLRQLGLLR